ncbi:hypothetical protein JTB14_027130 [Gonioctena quinquepunctata]|nr:hypothetical protein JTB14_027130 [Gonioctena quinquepunctata]
MEECIELIMYELCSSGFSVAGIKPFDDQLFSDDEFPSSYVTDRPEKISQGEKSQVEPSQVETSLHTQSELSEAGPSQYQPEGPNEMSQAGPSQAKSSYAEPIQIGRSQIEPLSHPVVIKETVSQIITPDQIRLHPKAKSRKLTSRPRKDNLSF